MRNSYPRKGHGRKVTPAAGALCCACHELATATVWVEFSYMRGDDEAMPVCARHAGMAGSLFSRFMSHCRTRDRHTGAEAGQ